MINKKTSKREIWLIYDYECPLCNIYCHAVRIKKDLGSLHLIDARKPSKLMEEITSQGIDIDNGMVLKIENNLYYGSDTIHILTLLSTPIGFFNRINYFLFSSKFIANILYPVCRNIRNILLFTMMRKKKINNLKEGLNRDRTNQIG